MENAHVLSALVRKRAEIAGQLEAAQAQVRQLGADMGHLDATIRLFAPDLDLDTIKPKPVRAAYAASHGEVSRIILDTLREVGQPVTTQAMGLRVIAARGLDTADPALARTVQGRVRQSLGRLRGRKVIRSEADEAGGLRWALA